MPKKFLQNVGCHQNQRQNRKGYFTMVHNYDEDPIRMLDKFGQVSKTKCTGVELLLYTERLKNNMVQSGNLKRYVSLL